jgi:DNA-binding Lrp family transcriptional regulator
MPSTWLLVLPGSSLADGLKTHEAVTGCEFKECPNAWQAFGALESWRLSGSRLAGAIIGSVLPDFEGLNLLEALRLRCPGLPVILLADPASGLRPGDELLPSCSHGCAEARTLILDPMCGSGAVAEAVKSLTTFPPTEILPPPPAISPRSWSTFIATVLHPDAPAQAVFAAVEKIPQVVSAHPVTGACDLVILLNLSAKDELAAVEHRIASIPGISFTAPLLLEPPALPPGVLAVWNHLRTARNQAYSRFKGPGTLLMIERAGARREETLLRIALQPGVAWCEPVRGPYDAIAMVRAGTSESLPRLVSRIQRVPGLIRLQGLQLIAGNEN